MGNPVRERSRRKKWDEKAHGSNRERGLQMAPQGRRIDLRSGQEREEPGAESGQKINPRRAVDSEQITGKDSHSYLD